MARALLKFRGEGFSSEATKRTAVSRAYYAAFCFLRNHEEQKRGFKPKQTPRVHRDLIDHLKAMGDDEIAGNLDNLRSHRNICDYDDKIENLDRIVASAFEIAKNILDYFFKK